MQTIDKEEQDVRSGEEGDGNVPTTHEPGRLTKDERELLKRKLFKFACGTCDMGASAPAQHVASLPFVAYLLASKF